MSKNNHFVVYSHGSGVQRDDRGLFTDISQSIPEVESVLFNYYSIDKQNKTLTICPFSSQIEDLNKIIADIRIVNPQAIIDLIAHSQGTIVVAMARPKGIRKVLLLAPVFDMGLERTLNRYRSRPTAHINLQGISTLPVLDGLVRIVPAQYWTERKRIKPFQEYNALAQSTEVIVIEARQDQILAKVDLSRLSSKLKLSSLDGDHGFSGQDRPGLIAAIRQYIL